MIYILVTHQPNKTEKQPHSRIDPFFFYLFAFFAVTLCSLTMKTEKVVTTKATDFYAANSIQPLTLRSNM